MPPVIGITPRPQNALNQAADNVLDVLAAGGRLYDRTLGKTPDAVGRVFSVGSAPKSAKQAINDAETARIMKAYPQDKFPNMDEGFVRRHFSTVYRPSVSEVFFHRTGGAFDAITGVGRTLSALNRDREEGNNSYSRTVLEFSKSSAQLGLGTAAAYGTAVVCGTAGAPLLAVGAAGVGVSWGVGALLDYFFPSAE